MKIQKRLAALTLTIILCCAFVTTSYGHDVPDMSQTGSVSASMTYENEPVSGGSLTLYKVGDAAVDDGNYSFVLTDDFAAGSLSLDDVTTPGLADELAAWAEENSLSGTTLEIGEDGTWSASGLELGLYLIVQYDPAEGYEAISPFLVSIPVYENGEYVYHVSAEPKMSTLTETPEETTVPSDPTGTTAPSDPMGTTDSVLPQTGQLNWPIPVLAVLGMCLILAGWWLRTGRQGRPHEA